MPRDRKLTLATRAIRALPAASLGCGMLLALTLVGGRAGAVTPLAPPRRLPAPLVDEPRSAGLQTAVLSGGCFWGVQGVFEHVRGVRRVEAGYAGGAAGAASYELVSTGATGHAESVRISFDPSEISYGQILRIFLSVATDPTQVGGQYPDQGSQYRGEIWYLNGAQRQVATRYIAQLNAAHAFRRPIAMRVDPFRGFFRAEPYHQDYLERHPDQPYIAAYDIPKVRALHALFPADWQVAAVLARG